MTIYGTGPITITHTENYQSVNYGGHDYGLIPAQYLLGWLKPNYPVPALLQDSQSDLGERWSNWMDTDRLTGHKY